MKSFINVKFRYDTYLLSFNKNLIVLAALNINEHLHGIKIFQEKLQ